MRFNFFVNQSSVTAFNGSIKKYFTDTWITQPHRSLMLSSHAESQGRCSSFVTASHFSFCLRLAFSIIISLEGIHMPRSNVMRRDVIDARIFMETFHYQKPVKMKLKFYCSAIREIAASMSNYDYQLHSRSRFAAAAAQNKIIIYCSPRKLSCNLSLWLAAGESHHRDDFASFSSLAGKAALLHHSAHRT